MVKYLDGNSILILLESLLSFAIFIGVPRIKVSPFMIIKYSFIMTQQTHLMIIDVGVPDLTIFILAMIIKFERK